MTSPVGNLIDKVTSEGISRLSLQCTNVSSKSNIKVFLSIIYYNYNYINTIFFLR